MGDGFGKEGRKGWREGKVGNGWEGGKGLRPNGRV